jgi:signal transduction histidine kinase
MLKRLASLRLWLVAAMVAAAVVGLVVSRIVFADLTKSREVAKDRSKAAFVAGSIARRVANGVDRSQLATIQSVLASDQITVYRRGRVVFSGVVPRGRGDLELAVTRPFPGGRVVLRDFESPGTSTSWTITVLTAAVLAAVILAAAITATVLVGTVRRPVERAVAAARRVAAGDYSARIGPTGPDELVELGTAFDDMASRLQAADQDQRRFLGDVAHEIATPINTIAGYALGLADEQLRDPRELQEASEVIRTELHRLRALLDDLRELIRLDLAHPGPAQPVELRELFDRLAIRFSPAARERDLALHVRGRGTISTDPRLLETVIDNLVSNALRHTPAGGEVTVTSHRHRHHTAIEVKDTGVGISTEHQHRIFDRFYRVEEARDRATGGSGIGLALAQRASHALGGHIELQSTPGRGSLFRVVLPAKTPGACVHAPEAACHGGATQPS